MAKKKQSKKPPKLKKNAWFVPTRWSYLPASREGWLLYIPYVFYMSLVFVVVKDSNYTIFGTLIGVIPYWVAGAVIMQWIASHKS